MGLNAKLIKRFNASSTSDVAHSSGYAKIQSGASFGTSDDTTFSTRQQIEQRRKYVKSYRNARIAQGVNYMPKARSAEEQAALAAEAAAILRSKKEVEESRQEYNTHLEKGGLRKYDTRNQQDYGLKRGAETSGANSSQSSSSRQSGAGGWREAAAARQAQAERFSGHANPTPKTGGFGRR